MKTAKTTIQTSTNIKTFAMATTLATLATATACSASPARSVSRAEARAAVHAFESDGNGFNTKNFFYDNGEQVVVFDTQFTPETAEKSIAFIRTKTSNPITHVVVTHPNPDKFNGIGAFRKLGAKVIASRRTAESMQGVHDYKKYYFVNLAKMFTEQTYPKLDRIDETFERTYDLRLRNGEVITLRELSGPGVSSNQTVALIPAARAAIVGDLVHHKAHAWLEGGIVNGKPMPTISSWIEGLVELGSLLKSEPETTVYGGRGEAVRIGQAVSAQIAYLKKADRIVAKYVRKLGARKAELGTDQAAKHHQALQAEFEKAFPDYALGYMIQYGVYGLAASKL